jgi:Gluconate 2-dehydrogenase subunit 3
MEATLRFLRKIGSKCSNWLLNACLAFAPRNFNQELGRRNAERKGRSGQWLTPEEMAVAEALTKIVIPSEEESPGIDEVGVLGPSAITSLDKMISGCPIKQHFYSRGLLSFDVWAMKEHGSTFPGLPVDQQTSLFRRAQEMNDRWNISSSLIAKVRRRFDALAQIMRGSFDAVMLYRIIRDDSVQIFYTSRVSWVWLDYDGPPMEKGYLNLTPRR